MSENQAAVYEDIQPESIKTKFPTVPKKYYVIDLLLRNPDGVSFAEIAEYVNCNELAVYSTMKRIRQHKAKNYSVIIAEKKAKIKVSKKVPTGIDIQNNIEEMKNYSVSSIKSYTNVDRSNSKIRYEKLVSLLKDNMSGININILVEKIGIPQQNIYSMIYQLKTKGFKITAIDGQYITTHIPKDFKGMATGRSISEKKLTTSNNQSSSVISSFKEKKSLPNGYIERIRRLPEHDRIDTYDMIKKSIYYQKSAVALMEANETIIQLNNEVMKGSLL